MTSVSARLGRVLMLAATAGTLVVAPAAPALARQPSGYVRVTFCNHMPGKIYLSLSYLERPGSKDWVVEGWKNINGGSCSDFDMPKGGWFYYYAEDDTDGFWGADDIEICVQHPGPFRRINRDGYTCDASELKGFRGVDPKEHSTYTVNIRP